MARWRIEIEKGIFAMVSTHGYFHITADDYAPYSRELYEKGRVVGKKGKVLPVPTFLYESDNVHEFGAFYNNDEDSVDPDDYDELKVLLKKWWKKNKSILLKKSKLEPTND